MVRWLTRLVVAALMPALVATGAVPGWTLFQCRHDHIVRLSPCCAGEDKSDTQDDEVQSPDETTATLTESGCCEVKTGKFDPAPASLSRAVPVPQSTPVLAIPAQPVACLAAATAPDLHRCPVNTGPPIRLRTLAFLN